MTRNLSVAFVKMRIIGEVSCSRLVEDRSQLKRGSERNIIQGSTLPSQQKFFFSGMREREMPVMVE